MGEVPLPGGRADSPVEVAALVLTLDQREMTLRCLETLVDQEGPELAIVVWDNGSVDGTADAVAQRFPTVLVHHHPRNLGVASGRNAAARLAMDRFAPPFLLFLDNDMELEPGFVRALHEAFATRPELGQTQAKLRYLGDRERINDGGGCRISFWRARTEPVGIGELDRGQYDRVTPCVSCGGAMMTRSEVFKELGGFDSGFDPVGPEDLDYSLRLQNAGHDALYVPRAVAYHAVTHTFGGGRYSEAYARHKARNWLRFLARHAPWHQKVAFFVVSAPLLALRVAVREGRRGNLGAMRGIARGVLELARGRSPGGRGPPEREP